MDGHSFSTPIVKEINTPRAPLDRDTFIDDMWLSLYEKGIPVERNRDMYVYWGDRVLAAQRRIDIAQEELSKLAMKDQLILFEDQPYRVL